MISEAECSIDDLADNVCTFTYTPIATVIVLLVLNLIDPRYTMALYVSNTKRRGA